MQSAVSAPPDCDCDGGVAHGDDEGGNDEDGERDQAHVYLPLPGKAEVYPALDAVFCRDSNVCQIYLFRVRILPLVSVRSKKKRMGTENVMLVTQADNTSHLALLSKTKESFSDI